ncbi:hypothetical protein HPB48_018344 [Haemaphysalis longicornis]|uniref:WH1 domain-containing protein n=1 Tax=Haemaphysalis longicornis TaxID=44386 RepID=A0A9J6G300_HAELO|nr:hypothetical protein HPB48_018344 [Haemaphysalis longicornis]
MAGSEAVIYCSSDIVKNSLKMGIEKDHHQDPEDSGRLSEIEVDQVESCFKSHKTYVYGCHCLANLYFTEVAQDGTPGRWELARTGVPVLILDKGESRARTRRMVHVKSAVTFHTMHVSSDHRRMAGLSFDVPDAAQEFWDKVEELISDPLNISLSVPKSSKSLKKKNRPSKPKPLPGKSDISLPCCFQHVTSVGSGDKERFYSLATLGPECEIE